MKVFFTLYREGQKQEVRQFRELLDISIVPAMKFQYYEALRNHYNRLLSPGPGTLPPKPPEYYIKADSKEAKDLIFSVFKNLKRSSGYGR